MADTQVQLQDPETGDNWYPNTTKDAVSGLAQVGKTNNYNDLDNKPAIPPTPVQSDWNESDTSSLAYIKNKPTVPPAQIQSDWNQNDTTAVDYIKNKPTIPAAQIQSDWNQTDNTQKDYIKNKPTVPAAQVNSDWNANSGVAQILNKPTIGNGLVSVLSHGQDISSFNLNQAANTNFDVSATKTVILSSDSSQEKLWEIIASLINDLFDSETIPGGWTMRVILNNFLADPCALNQYNYWFRIFRDFTAMSELMKEYSTLELVYIHSYDGSDTSEHQHVIDVPLSGSLDDTLMFGGAFSQYTIGSDIFVNCPIIQQGYLGLVHDSSHVKITKTDTDQFLIEA